MDMVDRAFAIIPSNTNLTLHSDQGWHYQHCSYGYKLEQKGVKQSMSRKGNCLDNAVIENFFGLLKSELLYLQKFNVLFLFLKELEEYIDYYNKGSFKWIESGKIPNSIKLIYFITVQHLGFTSQGRLGL